MLWLSRFPSPMTLTLDFQGQILKKPYLMNGMADWHGTKGMWVDRMLDSHCDFKLWPHPWPWPWIFKVKYWNCCNSGMGRSTHLEWKGCESHGAWQIDRPSNGSMFFSAKNVDITGRETRQSENLRIPEGVIGIRRRTIRFSGVSLNNFFHNKISYKYSINSYKFQLKEYLLSGSSLPLIPK